MKKITREDLLSLEKYSEVRNDFRSKVIKHKKNRRLEIGPNATLYFEDNFFYLLVLFFPFYLNSHSFF